MTGTRREAHRHRTFFSGKGFGLGHVLGVAIEVDWSLLIIFALIAFNLGAGVFPQWHSDWNSVLTWGMALGAAVLFFASILVHELSHAVVARRHGIPVHRITLFLFGGLAHMEREPPSPKAEFWMAVVGPVTSLLIGVGATLAGAALAHTDAGTLGVLTGSEAMRGAFRHIGPVATLLLWLGPINLLLGAFNVVPGFPLDGGRVLRSIVWGITDDLDKATRWASAAGRLVAWALMAIGAMYFFAGALGEGLWLALIGWFLNNAARTSYQQLVVQRALENVSVARVMRTQLERIPPDISVETFVREHLMPSDQQAFPVESQGMVLGLISSNDLRALPHATWNNTTVRAAMTPIERLRRLSADADAEKVLTELANQDGDQLPVFDGDRLVGLVGRRDVLRWLALRGRAS